MARWAWLVVIAGCAGPSPAPDAGLDGARPAVPDAPSGPDAGPVGCIDAVLWGSAPTDRFDDTLGTTTVSIDDRAACARSYTLDTTAPLRDGLPAHPLTIAEGRYGGRSIRTGHDLFDALYALALAEAEENSVEAIHDWGFDGGRAIDCGGCFETGRLWTYVWTRDTSYSVLLGLGALDPSRARRSLEFKLSERRGGGGLEVIQDTGSGGSWPVSTDRVVWALGAQELLGWLDGAERASFAGRALEALRHTIERDRRTIFDAATGLYRGESSFLDWREQTYPGWVAGELQHIAASEALSTNALHLAALQTAATLADEAADPAAARWRGWAADLRAAIVARLWDPTAGLFSAYTTTALDPSPVRRWDLLGEALAILTGVATDAQADRVLSAYPHVGTDRGAPVIFPEQQLLPIYHDRAEWPFVTALWLRAARQADHDAAADRAVRSLVRGAALALSNMEAFEVVSGASWLDDGAYSGPVVSSHRQLWSVAGYLGMVERTLFGLEATATGVRVRPYLTRGLRRTLFANADTLVLRGAVWRGHVLDVVVHLPAVADGGGSLPVVSVALDGADVGDRELAEAELGARSRIDVVLGEAAGPASTITSVDPAGDWRLLYGPRTPAITGLTLEGGSVRVGIDRGGEPAGDVTIAVLRDGARVADALPGTTASYLDAATDAASVTHCWALETCFVSSGTCSQHSAPSCFWGTSFERARAVDATSFVATGGSPVTQYGRFFYEAWGDPGDRLEAPGVAASWTGRYLVQVLYGQGGPVDTGITCGLQWVRVEDEASSALVGGGMLVMPQRGAWDRWGESAFVPVTLAAGHSYRFSIGSADDAANMSSFEHFARYTGGAGGTGGAFDRVNIAELRLLYLGP